MGGLEWKRTIGDLREGRDQRGLQRKEKSCGEGGEYDASKP